MFPKNWSRPATFQAFVIETHWYLCYETAHVVQGCAKLPVTTWSQNVAWRGRGWSSQLHVRQLLAPSADSSVNIVAISWKKLQRF
jgi:hypothetical protein